LGILFEQLCFPFTFVEHTITSHLLFFQNVIFADVIFYYYFPAYNGCIKSVLKIDESSLHVDPHRLGSILLENSFAISRTDRLRVLPRDVASGKKE
jgi:hypothetical protein